MPRGVPISDDVEAAIKAALEKKAHASLVARESKGAWSYATVWRVAARARIELTAGRQTMGRPLPPERRGNCGASRGGASRSDAGIARAAMRREPVDGRPGAARAAGGACR